MRRDLSQQGCCRATRRGAGCVSARCSVVSVSERQRCERQRVHPFLTSYVLPLPPHLLPLLVLLRLRLFAAGIHHLSGYVRRDLDRYVLLPGQALG